MKIMIGGGPKEGKMDDYEMEHCAAVLMEAEDIKADAEKMAKLKPYLAAKAKQIKSLADLKVVAKRKIAEDMKTKESDDDESSEY